MRKSGQKSVPSGEKVEFFLAKIYLSEIGRQRASEHSSVSHDAGSASFSRVNLEPWLVAAFTIVASLL